MCIIFSLWSRNKSYCKPEKLTEWNDFFSNINETTFFCERIYHDAEFFQIAKENVDVVF